MFWMNILPQFRYYHTLGIMMFFRNKKGFWCIKITNQIISLLKGYTLMKEHSFLHSRLCVWPFMNILPHQLRICEYLSIQNSLLIWKNIAPCEVKSRKSSYLTRCALKFKIMQLCFFNCTCWRGPSSFSFPFNGQTSMLWHDFISNHPSFLLQNEKIVLSRTCEPKMKTWKFSRRKQSVPFFISKHDGRVIAFF